MNSFLRLLAPPTGFLLLLIVSGCGGSSKTVLVPASGTVTLGESAMTSGTVTFHPDESKGNTEKLSPTGMIDGSGNYNLTTDGRDGAPVGWYKVTVTQGMSMSMPSDSAVVTDPTKSLANKSSLNSKYQSAATSGISIEVLASQPQGGYTIKLYK
jgi:hypothetical protein